MQLPPLIVRNLQARKAKADAKARVFWEGVYVRKLGFSGNILRHLLWKNAAEFRIKMLIEKERQQDRVVDVSLSLSVIPSINIRAMFPFRSRWL